MTTYTIKQVQEDFGQFISKTLIDNEISTISTDDGAVVVVSEREWNALQETILLMKDKKSFGALIDGQKARSLGKLDKLISSESAFYDLQG